MAYNLARLVPGIRARTIDRPPLPRGAGRGGTKHPSVAPASCEPEKTGGAPPRCLGAKGADLLGNSCVSDAHHWAYFATSLFKICV